jgi:hypothetical protein
MIRKNLLALALLVVTAAPLGAAPLANGGVERLSYNWHLSGALSWIARIAFPSSGHGVLETTQNGNVSSRLLISTDDAKGYYLYESSMLADGLRTLTSRSAYSFRDSARDERVAFDVANRSTHLQRTNAAGTETKAYALTSAAPQDVLTSIYYLRQHASEIAAPKRAQVFSGARGYDVTFVPQPLTMMGTRRVRPFTITANGNDAKRFGEVRVWLSEDEQHVPVRIDIQQRFTTLKLDLAG